MSNQYRPDVDGLRALAVIPVIFFHLDLVGFSGGYIGVDVFFVISGYLITGLIYSDIKNNNFSVKNFYIRRIRRISPALLVTLFSVTSFSFFILKPEALRSFALSLSTQSFSAQNFVFLSEGEYFLGSDLKPLLHTWSLAVEEQFYLFWPLLLFGLRRFSFKVQILLLSTIMVASFFINIGLMGVSPKASFFLLPPRAWELGAGGIIALLETKPSFQKSLSHNLKTSLGFIGLVLLCFSIFKLTPKTPFPGYAALIPVVGSAFLLISGSGSLSMVGRALSYRPLVLIGLISYPMYLWHWPIISLSHQFDIDHTSPLTVASIIFATLFLSVITYRYIETPIRSKTWFPSTKKLLAVACSGFVVVTAFGAHIWFTDGASYRYSSAARNLLTAPLAARTARCGFIFKVFNPTDQVCALVSDASATRRVLLWGNSHADHWSALFTDLAHENNAAFYLNARNCRATVDHDFCGKHVQNSILGFITSERITDVVLSSTGYGSYNVPDDVFEQNLRKLVHRLAGVEVRIWLVVDVPTGRDLDPNTAYAKNPKNPKVGSISLTDYKNRSEREHKLYDSLAGSYGTVKVIDPSNSLCDGQNCFGGKGNVVWYRDAGHVSDAGARATREEFAPVFKGR